MKLVPVCVWKDRCFTNLLGMSVVNVTTGKEAPPRGTVERVRFVADLRNRAMKDAIEQNPTHILMIDEYYLGQDESIQRLVDTFTNRLDQGLPSEMILGASTWTKERRDTVFVKKRFYDFGTTPEARNLRSSARGIMPVRAVGACYIFPVEAWLKNGYQCNPNQFEPEHVSLCKGFHTYLDLDVKLLRPDRTDAVYPISKALRVKLGKWRRKLCVT